MARLVSDERGSALMLAAIAMLVLGVLSISFALLADMETKIGVSYKQQAQAEAMAEVGLEMARDFVRLAPAGTKGFTRWFDGTIKAHMLFDNVPLFTAGHPLAAARFSARIDNDCPAANPGPPSWFPTSIKEPDHTPGPTACDNTTDYNEVAVITAWASSGTGRSRVRAIVAVDNPWKHVCSDAKPDNNGYCNDALNRNGSPEVTPADPNDPNGPQGYNNLPRPVLGCSRVAPELHRLAYAVAVQRTLCRNTYPAMYTFPYPVAHNVAPRFVLMGEDPANPAAQNPKSCNDEPNPPAVPQPGNGHRYFGYFDCSLTSYCHEDDGHVCAGLPDLQGVAGHQFRTGCLPGLRYAAFFGLPPTAADTRVVAGPNQALLNPGFTSLAFPPATGAANAERWGEYDPASGTCVHGFPAPPLPAGPAVRPGLVLFSGGPYNYASGGNVNFGADVGSPTRQFDVYVFHASWSQSNNREFYGTLAVETNGGGGVQFQVGGGGSSKLWAGANTIPPAVAPAPWAAQCCAAWNPPNTYGYPLVSLTYDPGEPPPTVQTAGACAPILGPPAWCPQPYTADFGSANTEIHGMVYSGGHVTFNPLAVDGTIVAYEIQTQGSANYVYNTWYGDNTPPPGFPTGSADSVVIIRKSFIVCVNYSDDTGTPTFCN